MANSPKITFNIFRIQEDTLRTIEALWSCGLSNVKEYKVRWWYKLAATDIGFVGQEDTVTFPMIAWTAPDNATKVTLQVQPVSKTYTNSSDIEVTYWTADWAPDQSLFFTDPPLTPSYPSIEIDEFKLTATLENISIDIDADQIEFQIVQDNTKIFNTGLATISTNAASYSCTVSAGYRYKVRCRAKRTSDGVYGEWSEYTTNYHTQPSTPTAITTCRASDETAVYLEWSAVSNADTYDIEYATKEEYFDGSDQVSGINGLEFNRYEKTGLTSGEKYFFRVRAVNSYGHSGWSPIVSVTIGEKPSAPTTWSSSTTAKVGEDLILYWAHNSADGSSQTYAELELIVDSGVPAIYTIRNTTDKEDKYKTSFLTLDTNGPCNAFYSYYTKSSTSPLMTFTAETFKALVGSYGLYTFVYNGSVWKRSGVTVTLADYGIVLDGTPVSGDKILVVWSSAYSEGANLKWRVRTAGITNVYGDWSIQRVVDIYAPPVLTMSVTDSSENPISTLEALPFYVNAVATPTTQIPLSYHLTISSNEIYETIDNVGCVKMVNKNEIIYSQYFDTHEDLLVEMSAGNISLYNNVEYTVKCVVSMNSGLTAEAASIFTVGWVEEIDYFINAEIGFDEDTYSMQIRPYCLDSLDAIMSDVAMSVYRRELDGSFVEIIKDLDNTKNTFVTDPHPSLYYARYRIVAKSETTGYVDYVDLPSYPILGNSIIIQWDEIWSDFDNIADTLYEQPIWSGSMLKIPYNIDVSDSNDLDVSLVNYIGRKRPVSYYGSQLGEKSVWMVEIPKSDKETLYAIRRLAIWAGDVYVREPSGSGYWANVSITYQQMHKNLTIPITFTITRVEGGV